MCNHETVAGLMNADTGEIIAVACADRGEGLDIDEVMARIEAEAKHAEMASAAPWN